MKICMRPYPVKNGNSGMTINSFRGKYRFLSNFYPAVTEHNGIIYSTSEHAYQAAKSHSDIDKHIIWSQDSPYKAKIQGRRITMRSDWDLVKRQLMKEILFSKFTDPTLRKQLTALKGYRLVEGNTWGDTYWGESPIGTGENNLGLILMELRDHYLNC